MRSPSPCLETLSQNRSETIVKQAHVNRILCLTCFLLASSALMAAEDSCDKLAQLAIPGTTIPFAQTVAAGKFAGPPAAFTGRDLTAFYKDVPAFCRVVAEAKPTADSDIRIEVWMPASGWNGKLQGIGNGGF